MIASIATLLLWLIGFQAELEKKHFHYQANSVKNKRVLSFLYLAKQIILHKPNEVSYRKIKEALKNLTRHYSLSQQGEIHAIG